MEPAFPVPLTEREIDLLLHVFEVLTPQQKNTVYTDEVLAMLAKFRSAKEQFPHA
jgi:hypothetical protein